MIDGLSPYPEYRPSGVEWLGEVPAHWEVLPLKRWVKINRAVLPDSTPPAYEFQYLDIGSVGTGVLTARPQRLRFAAAPSRARRVVGDGDTIVSTVRTYLKAVYFVDRDSEDLICSTGFAVLTPRTGTVPKFISYLCQSSAFTDSVTADSVGIAYPAIAENRLGAFQFAIPPLPEQTAIVRFLDLADRRIRRAVQAKRRLIALLNEEKQAIIHHAVTRGLEPDVPLKPSGVEWLGDVPAHWEILSLGAGSRSIQTGPFGSQLHSHEYVEDGIPIINPSHLHEGTIIPEKSVSVNSQKATELERHRLRKGDIVMARRGDLGRSGLVHENQEGWLCGTGSLRVRQRPDLFDSEYLVVLLGSSGVRDTLRMASIGSTMDNLNAGTVAQLRLPCPPLEDQHAIVKHIADTSEEITSAITAARREIDLLLEFRTRLIADVVTGKLDVRGVAAGLPETTPGQATLDAFDAPAGDEEDTWPEPGAALEDDAGIGA